MRKLRSSIVLVVCVLAGAVAPCAAQIFIPDASKDIIKVPPPNVVDKNSVRIDAPAPDERCGRLAEPLRRQTPGCR